MSVCRILKLNRFLSLCIKVNSKWIEGLHMKSEILKLPRKTLQNTDISKYFLKLISISWESFLIN